MPQLLSRVVNLRHLEGTRGRHQGGWRIFEGGIGSSWEIVRGRAQGNGRDGIGMEMRFQTQGRRAGLGPEGHQMMVKAKWFYQPEYRQQQDRNTHMYMCAL